MLVLTRKQTETIKIGDSITITILRLKGQAVRVGIDAPRDVRVIRGELTSKESELLAESLAVLTSAQEANDSVEENLEEENPQVVQFRFSPQKTAAPVSTTSRGPLSGFLTNLHTPGYVAETVTG